MLPEGSAEHDGTKESLARKYAWRAASGWQHALRRALMPPVPYVHNPAERQDFPLGRWNLYVGGAGVRPVGYINIDIVPDPHLDAVADAARLPFGDQVFRRIECDAVLEHVRELALVVDELHRVLAPEGDLHVVVPFCHPFHAFPWDYRRFTLEGLRELFADRFTVVAEGWRTGPTATLLVFVIEYFKLLLPWRVWRIGVHFALGWVLFPLRYLDLLLFRTSRQALMGNHCYLWLRRKPDF